MTRYIRRIFGNRWVVNGLAFLAIALMIWLLGPFLAVADRPILESALARTLVILVVALLWVIVILIFQLRRRKADQRLFEDMSDAEKAAAATADQVPAQTLPCGVEEEKAILRQRFQEAVDVLRKPGGAKQRKPVSLYELPWYIIIGPPGCGKTTALVNSGIEFPLAEHFGQAVLSGIGGTRNCDWWISNEAVLIDTAGRYTTQNSDSTLDSAAWTQFLELLKKYRRRRPINGALVAFSLTDLMGLDETVLEQHARTIRRRLNELTDRLGISIPVYLIFTKADLIAGFIEFFDDLDREERQQVWGATLPLDGKALKDTEASGSIDPSLQYTNNELPALIERLNGRLNWRLISERDLKRRAMILGFPQQIATLEKPIQHFLHHLASGSRFEKQVFLRGIYFSSGTQEGTPIDRLMGALAEAVGLGRQNVVPGAGHGKSYFITDLLRKVVFQELNLAGSDRRAERILNWVRRGAYAAVILLTLGATLAWTTSFIENKAFTADIEARLRLYEELIEGSPPEATDYVTILPRLDALRELLDYVNATAESPSLSMRMGLYRGSGIVDATRDTYRRALHAYLLPGLAANLEQQLADGEKDASVRYETLKLYLMLAEPTRMEPDLLKLWASDLWSEMYPANPRLQGQLKNHLAALVDYEIMPIEPDKRLVNWVRESLEQQPLAELIYGRLKLAPAVREAQPMRYEDIIGRNGLGVFSVPADGMQAMAIPGLFTYRGFYRVFQPEALAMASRIKDEAWVYGDEKPTIISGQLENIEDAVLNLYIDEYIRHWDNLLAQLHIASFSTLAQALEVSSRLIRPDSPLRHILDTVEANTRLTRLPQGSEPLAKIGIEVLRRQNYYLSRLIGAAQQGAFDEAIELPPKRVERHFDLLIRMADRSSGDGLSHIQRLLGDLYSQLSALEPAGGLPESPLSKDQGSQSNVFHSLRTEAARTPDPVRRWLRQIAANSQTVVLGNTGIKINEVWGSSIAPLCKQLVEGRYPFNPSAKSEVNLQDFGKLFGDGGVFDIFFAEHLEPFVDTATSPWRWRSTARENLGVKDESLIQLERAQRIKAAFFPEGGKHASVRFSLLPRRIDPAAENFVLSYGGQVFNFERSRPSPVDGEWPGRNVSNYLTMSSTPTASYPSQYLDSRGGDLFQSEPQVPPLTPEPVEEIRQGQWAFFRLVHSVKAKPGIDHIQTIFSVGSFRHVFELQAFSVVNPFSSKDLQDFRCLERL